MKKLSGFIIEKRFVFLSVISLLTIFFMYRTSKIEVYTKFADLLPQGHEYIKVHNKIRVKFGGANTVNMLFQVKEGDIFNTTTLQKIKDITEELYLIPGVDRFKIFSIAVNYMVDMVVTSGGFDFQPIMWPDVPQTEEEIETLKERVYASNFYGSFVWFDNKKTLITADFFEDEIDYTIVFKALRRIQEKYEDDKHILSVSGEPLRIGYVDSYVWPIFRLMIITFLVMMGLFYYWYRSVRATLIPFLAAFISGIWGVGFMDLLGYNLDPLILVFPFLIASRAACHTVQVIKRYTEECIIAKDGKSACKRVIEGMFVPGFTAITTDAMGIILIALTPIQILQKITLSCTFWCVAQIIIAIILVPILLSYLPISPSLLKKFERKGIMDRILVKVGALIGGKGRLVMFTSSVVTTFAGSSWLLHEGDPNWYFFPTTDRAIIGQYGRVTRTGVPGSADRYVDAFEETSANIVIYCRDKMTSTIKTVMARVNEYLEKHSRLELPMRYKLAGGVFGIQAAINEVIEIYHARTLGWALLAIFLICWIMFRSIMAAFILTIPLVVSNLIAYAMMATGMFSLLPTPITITTSTLPVSAVGIGLGVDYGIYMLGRILEEYKVGKDLQGAISTTMSSVGEPVVFTALAMTGGLIVWVFSPLMFQATMGFFLATILLLNMLGGLLLVPSFVAVIKPKFVVG